MGRATDDVHTSTMTSTFSASNHSRDLRPDLGLVLVVSEDDLDLQAPIRRAKILDGHECCDPRTRPGRGGIGSGLVVQDADLDDAVGYLGVGWWPGEAQHGEQRRGAYYPRSQPHRHDDSRAPEGTGICRYRRARIYRGRGLVKTG